MHAHELREFLAALEHEQWSHWTKYMLEVLGLSAVPKGLKESNPKAAESLERWHRQIETDYDELTEKEKDSDREWADKIFDIFNLFEEEDLNKDQDLRDVIRSLYLCQGLGFPYEMMSKVVWCFRGSRFNSLDVFSREVRDHHISIMKSDERWSPENVVFSSPVVEISYQYCDEDDRRVVNTFRLDAQNGKEFTAADLLFQIHNETIKKLRNMDHCYFEGLWFEAYKDDVLRYYLLLGS